MALTACPECSGKVAESAALCPHCGYPLGPQKTPPTVPVGKSSLKARARPDRPAPPATAFSAIHVAMAAACFAAGLGVGLAWHAGGGPASSAAGGAKKPAASRGPTKAQFKKKLDDLGFHLKGLGTKGTCPQSEFYAKLGDPQGRMLHPGSGVDFTLTYPCSDGTIQMHIIEGGGAGDKVFLMTVDEF